MTQRTVLQVAESMPTSDGAGVSLRRALGTPRVQMVDPFLMLDEFSSDKASDYIAGFPDHPHRGFETVTYMLDGKMEHRDSVGNHGLLRAGSVQWMTAGRGIIHSEMPQQDHGLMRGFQLWVNLPAAHKMVAPRYQDIAPEAIPVVEHEGATVKVIAGDFAGAQGPVGGVHTEPRMYDVQLPAGTEFHVELPDAHAAFVYVFEGEADFGPVDGATHVSRGNLAVLSQGEQLRAQSAQGGRFLVLAGKPIGEPVARYGPFVMNTREEIEQAFADYRAGRLAT